MLSLSACSTQAQTKWAGAVLMRGRRQMQGCRSRRASTQGFTSSVQGLQHLRQVVCLAVLLQVIALCAVPTNPLISVDDHERDAACAEQINC